MKWICSFKAYGDLVIACNFLRYVDLSECGLLLGSHLIPLLGEFGFEGKWRSLEVGADLPALFDIKKRGYFDAIGSAFQIRRSIRAIGLNKGDTLIFDALGPRQSLIAWPIPTEQIYGGEPNIYLDYHRYFDVALRKDSIKSVPSKIVVFPDSRLRHKVLPDQLVVSLCRENWARGIQTLVVKVGKAKPLPELRGCQVKWINGFSQLIDEIGNAKAVVSADSLPAHLAEYAGVPVFVFTPSPNEYWMPLSVYLNGHSSSFEDISCYRHWLSGNESPEGCLVGQTRLT